MPYGDINGKCLIRIIICGDIALKHKQGLYPFSSVEHLFREKDLAIGNLETVLTKRPCYTRKRTILKTRQESIIFLKKLGIDIVNIANNHILDCGVEGYYDTINTLRSWGIAYVGEVNGFARNVYIFEKCGIKIAFLGYDLTKSMRTITNALREVWLVKKYVDTVILFLHWGCEYSYYPAPWQRKIARAFIDAGASIILGHHPHVIQGIERYKNGIIFYSLGNFQFNLNIDNMYKFKYSNTGLVVHITLSRDGVVSYKVFPVGIDKDGNVVNVNEKERMFILNLLSKLSASINLSDAQWYEITSENYLKSQIDGWIEQIRKYGVPKIILFLLWLMHSFTIKMISGFIRRKIREVLR